DRIIKLIIKHFKNFSDEAEISCEIDPRFLDQAQTDILVGHGFNRVSFGVQDFDEKVQKTIHRIQPFELTDNAVKMVRKAGIKSVNMDLIYGLPFQTSETFKKTLEMALKLDTDRFAVFNYAHVPWMKKTMRKIDETTLPHPSEKLTILKYTIDYLTSNGLRMIGMDHFAKPDDELFLAIDKGELHRNFQGYTTKGGADLVGVGLTSIGEGVDYYAQNYKDMKEYEEAIDNDKLPFYRGVELNFDDKVRKYVIMELMANFKLDIKRFEKEFGLDFKSYFKDSLEELKEFEDEGLIKIGDEFIDINKTGSLLIRNIAMCFDAYLKRHGSGKKVFSKTV
ncbi:MAG TPA: oxygen-independent coproporphyrinogen III oxidase, partial [Campylobacterales bacterium]|nr:oxygen-independent coproporphyrinogen III oxidase [Campylobacterales bacterium]